MEGNGKNAMANMKPNRQMSFNQVRRTTGKALERLGALEQDVQQLAGQIRQLATVFDAVIKQLTEKLNNTEEVTQAMVNIVGTAEVEQEVESGRAEKLEARKAASQAALAEMVSNGIAVKVEKIEDQQAPKKTLIVLYEQQDDGTIKAPGYAAMFLDQFKPDVRTALMGQAPGFSYKVPDDTVTLFVTDVYVIDESVAQKLTQEQQAAQAVAAPVAEQPAVEQPAVAAPVVEAAPPTETPEVPSSAQ